MVKQINVNIKALESMLFIWATLKDRQKIADEFYINLAASPEMQVAYDEDFDQNGFRKVLSAISNNELMSVASQKEKRFWNNNMWMLEDLSITERMLAPIKTLNLDKGRALLPETIPYQTMEVVFYPGTTELCMLKKDKLYINFFKVNVNIFDEEEEAKIDGKPIADFILKKLADAR